MSERGSGKFAIPIFASPCHQQRLYSMQPGAVITRYISSHYSDVTLSSMASQITGYSIVYSNVCSGTDQRKHQSYASLAFVRGIQRWPVNSPYKGSVTRKMFPFDNVIIQYCSESVVIYIRVCDHKKHPYLTLKGKLWGVYFRENCSRYNGTALYLGRVCVHIISAFSSGFPVHNEEISLPTLYKVMIYIQLLNTISIDARPWGRFNTSSGRGLWSRTLPCFPGRAMSMVTFMSQPTPPHAFGK